MNKGAKSIQHLHFPRGPPPEYSASSTTFDFRVPMVSGRLAVIWSYAEGVGNDVMLKTATVVLPSIPATTRHPLAASHHSACSRAGCELLLERSGHHTEDVGSCTHPGRHCKHVCGICIEHHSVTTT